MPRIAPRSTSSDEEPAIASSRVIMSAGMSAPPRKGSRASNSAAISQRARPARHPLVASIIADKRGCAPSRLMRFPSGVIAPASSIAPRSTSSARAAAAAPSGGGSGKRQFAQRRAPGRAIQHQAGQFAVQNFRTVVCAQAPLGGLRPKPDGETGRFTPCAPCALIRRRAADAFCRQPRQPAGRIETRRATKTAIDHDPARRAR